ncbi:MAG: aminoacetone oxidase family FAD-binding enzyme [Clostridiales bacterium]|nr:aminoacetone oxidase family FAD-binding enzyme [Clostridiales bacterium]
MKRILIVGGGAAGLAAALSAAKANPSAQITVLEGLDRVGKKLLATGNGRCNLTNADITPAHYHSSQPEALARLVSAMPTDKTLSFFASLGLYCAEEEQGRIYPYSRQASMVVDVLLLALERSHVKVACGSRVSAIRRDETGFRVRTEAGTDYGGDTVILTAGGRAAPKQGTDGSGYGLAKRLGHRYAPLFPCLVPLTCDAPHWKGLKGVRAQGRVTLLHDGQAVAAETGELQFTEYGLSGIPVFQLSCHLGADPKGYWLSVDLLPGGEEDALVRLMRERCSRFPETPLEDFLLGLIHKRLLYAVMKTAGVGPLSRPAGSLSPEELTELARGMKGWLLPVTGTLGWAQAQVTGGGVLLSEVDERFASKRCPGLYLAGEMLDAVGDCGGYNLHWAWCSGMTAGEAAAGI